MFKLHVGVETNGASQSSIVNAEANGQCGCNAIGGPLPCSPFYYGCLRFVWFFNASIGTTSMDIAANWPGGYVIGRSCEKVLPQILKSNLSIYQIAELNIIRYY